MSNPLRKPPPSEPEPATKNEFEQLTIEIQRLAEKIDVKFVVDLKKKEAFTPTPVIKKSAE